MKRGITLAVLGVIGTALLSGAAVADTVQVQILSAVVKDQKVPGATVTLQKNGAQSSAQSTDGQGQAALSTAFSDTADTLLIVRKEGYSTLVAKCPCQGMTYALSPVMNNLDGLRIVLNWGATPPDLDSHVAFGSHHIYFGRKTDGHGTDANLDVDDTDSYGPETITIEKKHFGQPYVYAVHDFTHINSPESKGLSNSGAKVLVYVGRSLVRSYYVPKNTPGNLWTVFRITGDGDFQDINTMKGTNVSNPDDVLGKVSTYLDSNTQVAEQAVSTSDSSSAKDINARGEQAYHAGDLDAAVDLYNQAIEKDPNYGQAYSNLGLAYQKAGRTSEAIWADRKAIALAGGSTAPTVRASSFYNIARIYEAAGQYQDALNNYQFAKREKANPVYDKAVQRVQAHIN